MYHYEKLKLVNYLVLGDLVQLEVKSFRETFPT